MRCVLETMNIANGDNAGDIRGDNTGGKEDISNIVIELMKETPSITAVKLWRKRMLAQDRLVG